MSSVCLLTLFTFCLLPVATVAQSGTDVKNLITKLFTTDTYNKKVRPLTDQSTALVVSVDFYLNSIIEFDEQEESLTTSGYLSLVWNDEYLVWTSATYNGITDLFLPQNDIWIPDISLRNTYKSFTGLGSTYLNLIITNTGDVSWEPFQVLKSTCSVDITYFPFDTQECFLKFTAWSYTKSEVELNVGTKGILLDNYAPNSGWEIASTSSSEVNTEEAAVIFTITLKRKPLFYLLNIITPVLFLTILNAFTFVLPVASGERASYAITVFLSLAVFLTIIASELPKNSDTTSVLSIYLMIMSSLSTFIVTACLVESRIAARDVETHPINQFYLGVYKIIQTLRFKRPYVCSCKNLVKPETVSNESAKVEITETTYTESAEKSVERDTLIWNDIVNAFDVALFWFCTLVTFVCTVVLVSMAINNKGY